MRKQSLVAFIKDSVHADSVGRKRDGTIMVRFGYYYRGSDTAAKYAEQVARVVGERATVIDSGDHWAAFHGGAIVANSSHFWVQLQPAS